MASTISAGTTAGTAIVVAGDTSGSLALRTNGTTTAVTIDTSQNVGIGTSSPNARLEIAKASGAADIRFSIAGTLYGNVYASTSDFTINSITAIPLTFGTNNTEQMRIDSAGLLKFNSGYGSAATAYGCRAWCNFNGTGTVAIRASGNVSSITDGGVGIYSLNLTTSMPDANYSTIITAGSNSANSFESNVNPSSTTSTVNINTHDYGNSYSDNSFICVAVFR